MWAELGHGHFSYVPAVSNVVTNGNGTGTKNVLKGTGRFGLTLVSCLLSLRRYYCSESKNYSLPGHGQLYVFTLCERRNQPVQTSVF